MIPNIIKNFFRFFSGSHPDCVKQAPCPAAEEPLRQNSGQAMINVYPIL